MALVRKTTLKIDVSKLDKERFMKYTDKEGNERIEMSVDLIETDNVKPVLNKDGEPVEGDTWKLENVGFIVETPTKEERAERKDTTIVGNGSRFADKTAPESTKGDADYPKEEINPEDIPF